VTLILDTDHCVAVLRGKLDVGRYITPVTAVFTTAITVSELIYGAFKSDRPRENLEQVDLLLEGVTVLPFDTAAARRCGELKERLRRAGLPIAEPDLQIASIALRHMLPLATHNTSHFDRVPGLTLVDWIG